LIQVILNRRDAEVAEEGGVRHLNAKPPDPATRPGHYNPAMARHASAVDDLLNAMLAAFKRAPWWAGAVAVAIVFLMLRFALPWVFGLFGGGGGPDNLFDLFATFSRALAPFAALIVAGVWAYALVAKATDHQRLTRQRGIDTIRELDWRQFEQLIATAYERQGYRVTDTGQAHGPAAPDGGIDLVLERDGQRTLVQCKHWQARRVGVQPARELYGVVASQHPAGGILVTSGRFTQDAHRFAETVPLQLIDGPKLQTLIQTVQPAPRKSGPPRPRKVKTPRPLPQSEISNHPSEIPVPAPLCPQCQSPMTQRTAKRGAHAGQSFWGCSGFPKCRGTRPL
jgi:restriction system protein